MTVRAFEYFVRSHGRFEDWLSVRIALAMILLMVELIQFLPRPFINLYLLGDEDGSSQRQSGAGIVKLLKLEGARLDRVWIPEHCYSNWALDKMVKEK